MPKRQKVDAKMAELDRSGTLNPHPEAIVDPLFQNNPFFDTGSSTSPLRDGVLGPGNVIVYRADTLRGLIICIGDARNLVIVWHGLGKETTPWYYRYAPGGCSR